MGNYWLDVEKLQCEEKLNEVHKRLSGEALRLDPWVGLPTTFTGDMREYQNRMFNATTPVCEFREETIFHEEFGEMDVRRVHEVGQITTRNLLKQAWTGMVLNDASIRASAEAEGHVSSGNWRSVEERRNTVHSSKESMARCMAAQAVEEEHPAQDERHGRGEWRNG